MINLILIYLRNAIMMKSNIKQFLYSYSLKANRILLVFILTDVTVERSRVGEETHGLILSVTDLEDSRYQLHEKLKLESYSGCNGCTKTFLTKKLRQRMLCLSFIFQCKLKKRFAGYWFMFYFCFIVSK